MKHKISLKGIITIFVFVLILSAAPAAFAETTDSWATKAPMTIPRTDFQTAVIGGKIYTIGGEDAQYNCSHVEVYDPASDTWTTKAPMPTQRVDFQTAVVGEKIYVIGGHVIPGSDTWESFSTVEEYDPKLNTWTTKASMSTPRSDFQTAVIDGKIYAIGGRDLQNHSFDVEVYDPATDTWTSKATVPTQRERFQAVVIGEKIYAIGGYQIPATIEKYFSVVEEYNTVSDTWTAKKSMTIPRGWHETAVIGGKIYSIGGYNEISGVLSSVEEYDPALDTWTTKASMSTPKMHFQTAVIDGKIYAIGGWRDSGGLSTVEEYDPASDTWTIKKPMSTPRIWHKARAINKKIYVIGGTKEMDVLTSVEVFTVPTKFNSTGAAIAIVILGLLTILLLNRILKRFGINVLPAIQHRIRLKSKSASLLLLCMIVFIALTACNTMNTGSSSNTGLPKTNAESSSTPNASSEPSVSIESSSNPNNSSSIVEHVPTVCSDPAVNEFLNNTDGHDYKIAVEQFTKAYFGGDISTVKRYLIHPESKLNYFNTKDMLADIELLSLKLGSDSIKDNVVHAQYEFREKGDDSFTYLDLKMKEVNSQWRVESFGIEK